MVQGRFGNAAFAFYFSGIAHPAVGYGDVVLTTPCWLLAPIESLIGVLTYGLSTGYFPVVLSRIHEPKQEHAVDLSSAEGRRL